nr:hypothetical protein BaRGS_017850 [Batillaria attramentaria]
MLGNESSLAFITLMSVPVLQSLEQTSVLLLGLLVAALGGCCTALMGSLDLTALLPLETGEDSAQVTITMVMIVLGTLCTMATARFRLRTTPDPVHNMPLTSSPQSLAQSSSAQAYAEKSRVEDDQSGRSTSTMARFLRAVTEKSGRNLVLVCVATFFATGVMQGFNMFIADFLGKEVFKGQPLADPGSDMTAFYDQGVRLASRGTLISFVSFGLVNLFNTRLLKHIGERETG